LHQLKWRNRVYRGVSEHGFARQEEDVKTFDRILLATDFSEASDGALEEAIRLAKESGAILIVTHAFQVPPSTTVSYVPANVFQEYEGALRAAASDRLSGLLDRIRSQGVEARLLLVEGFADEEIVEAAAREKADLVVIGTHGRQGVARFFLGSVAARVVATCPCPVLTVRPSRESSSGR
jgi:nucleotide-binding universal stress UspA family protein